MPTRLATGSTTSSTSPLADSTTVSFLIDPIDKQYGKQYANLYWLRLVVLRNRLKKRARHKWSKLKGTSIPPQHVERMLDVENGKLCYIIGTLYMDMPLKPNVLEDLAREHYIAAPPARRKFCAPATDDVMLEDESGRVRLVGRGIDEARGTFVTGTIMAALGAELPSGDFEVLEYCFAGSPPAAPSAKGEGQQKGKGKAKSDDDGDGDDEWVALVSGLEMGARDDAADVRVQMLGEWLSGEVGADEDSEQAVKITKLILAGNSLAQPDLDVEAEVKPKRYGYDSSLFSSKPTAALDAFLNSLLPSISVDLMPGEKDPTAPTMPQQLLHPALLPDAAEFERFERRTNPFWSEVGGTSFLGTSGQTLDDIFKYLESEDRAEMAQRTLEWSHISPTCPDTLWCYPFSDRDPFILHRTPDVYFIGNQPSFSTRLVQHEHDGAEGSSPTQTRIVLVPSFRETGECVLVNTKTLEVKLVGFGI